MQNKVPARHLLPSLFSRNSWGVKARYVVRSTPPARRIRLKPAEDASQALRSVAPETHLARLLKRIALKAALLLLGLLSGSLQPRTTSATPVASAYRAPDVGGPQRFRFSERPIKVVVVAGSIGAFRGASYARHIARRCHAVEVANLSATGLGASALRQRFVAFDRKLYGAAREPERWLLFAGGLNSISNAPKTILDAVNLFHYAHERGYQVAAMTPTPWGSLRDPRFRGKSGADYVASTQAIVDFYRGKHTPAEALGTYLDRRTCQAEVSSFAPTELPDLTIDLWHSPLRAQEAEDVTDRWLWGRLLADRQIRSDLKAATDRAAFREKVLKAHRQRSLNFMEARYRGFDHIHPNADGHQVIFQQACKTLPKDWRCDCLTPF